MSVAQEQDKIRALETKIKSLVATINALEVTKREQGSRWKRSNRQAATTQTTDDEEKGLAPGMGSNLPWLYDPCDDLWYFMFDDLDHAVLVKLRPLFDDPPACPLVTGLDPRGAQGAMVGIQWECFYDRAIYVYSKDLVRSATFDEQPCHLRRIAAFLGVAVTDRQSEIVFWEQHF